jgi:hypothetical protein
MIYPLYFLATTTVSTAIVRGSIFSVRPLESFTRNEKVNEPAEEGVPVTTPDGDKAKVVGSDPLERLYVKGGTPPRTCANWPKFAV